MATRKRKTGWRWSYLSSGNVQREQAGTMLAGSAKEVLDAVSWDEGARGEMAEGGQWPTGGWARYDLPASQGGGTLTVVAVLDGRG